MQSAISALRAIIEFSWLAMLGQAALHVLAGQHRRENPVYQLFDLLTRPWRKILAMLLGKQPDSGLVAVVTFLVLLVLWMGLAILRRSL